MSYDPLQFGLGYAAHLEDRAMLAATARPMLFTASFSAPESISHRGWRKAKNQGGVGSCSGFSRASGEEVLNYIATNGSVLHFSEMFAYLCNQRACGLFGSDQGATIDGSCRAARESGICLSDTFPYPGHYVTDIPEAAVSEGKRHLVGSWSIMKSYDDCYNWLASGVGVILDGTDWLMGMTGQQLNLEMRNLSGRMLGGHAKVIHGYGLPDKKWMQERGRSESDYQFVRGAQPAVDSDGRPYLDEENSHDEGYGDYGFKLISPRVIDYWVGSGATLIGISDLTSYGPRAIPNFRGAIA